MELFQIHNLNPPKTEATKYELIFTFCWPCISV